MKNPNLAPLEVALTERQVMLQRMAEQNLVSPHKSLIQIAEDFLAHERQIEQLRQSLKRSVGFQEWPMQKNSAQTILA